MDSAQPMDSFGSDFAVPTLETFGSRFNQLAQPTLMPNNSSSSYMDMLGDSITISEPQVR
jgi:hypothetical protein